MNTEFKHNLFIRTIMDKRTDPEEIYKSTLSFWDYNPKNDNVGDAYKENREFRGYIDNKYDIDLLSMLYELSKNNIQITIPYTDSNSSSLRENQKRNLNNGVYGPLINIISSKDFSSFSLSVFDKSIETTIESGEESGKVIVGEIRKYSLTNYDGKLLDKWRSIITNNLGNPIINISFKELVSSLRWANIYTPSYFKTQLAINQLDKYSKYLNTEIKRLLNKGIKYEADTNNKTYHKKSSTDTQKIKVPCIEVEVDASIYETGEYPITPSTLEDLERIIKLRRNIIYTWIPTLRTMVKATQLSFKNIIEEENEEPIPAWITQNVWERDFKLKGKRISWNRFKVDDIKIGGKDVFLRYRIYEKTATVKLNYEF